MGKHDGFANFKAELKEIMTNYSDDPTVKTLSEIIQTKKHDGQMYLFFEGDINTKYRFIVPYLGQNYIVCWLQMSSDGSVYFGVREPIPEKRQCMKTVSQDGKIVIKINEDSLPPLIPDIDNVVFKDRFSFHGSGEIHSLNPSEKTFRSSIRNIKDQSELFGVLFKDVSNFDEWNSQRKNDIHLIIDLDESNPLFLRTWIAPSDQMQLDAINGGNGNFIVIINFHEIEGVGNLSLQLVFAPLPSSDLPQKTVVFWPTIDNDSE